LTSAITVVFDVDFEHPVTPLARTSWPFGS